MSSPIAFNPFRAIALAAFAVSISITSANAIAKQNPPTVTCRCVAGCACQPGDCRCPQVVTLPNGMQVRLVPGKVDTRGAWPWQGPIRWTGAIGRWGVGAQPRFR